MPAAISPFGLRADSTASDSAIALRRPHLVPVFELVTVAISAL
jgi:hypothetical protein